MGEAYRGLTIQFKADGTKVLSTLKSMTRAANQVESELRMVKKGLRFDAGSTKLAVAQLKLLEEKAGTARGTLALMRREYRELGKVKIDGVEMKELSARTKDASTQAEAMRAHYANVTKELAVLHNKATEAWAACKVLSNVPNPFKGGWNEFSTSQIQSFISYMEEAGAVTSAEAAQMRGAVSGLRSEFKSAGAALEKLDHIAEYQSFGNKISQQSAMARAAIKEMNAAAKAFRPTGFEDKIRESRVEVERLEAQAKELKAAMRLDPSSFALVSQHAETLRAKMVAIEGETKDLRAEMRALGAQPGVKEAASDAQKLETNLREARAEVDSFGNKLAAAKGKANALGEEVNELKLKIMQAASAEEMFLRADEYHEKLSELRRQRELVDQLGSSYARAEEKVQLYNRAVRYNESSGQIAANEAAIASMQQKSAKKMKLLSSSAATALGMTMYSTLYPAVMMAGSYAIQSAEDVDAAYRNMRKTVQGTNEEFEQLKKNALEFGDTHYTAADDLLQIEAIGGQLGITVDNLEAFSKTIANLNIATNVDDSEELATQFGKMASVMGLSSEEYDKFADSLVRLGNSEPAMESDILNMTTRFMGMGKVVGMSADEMLAWATTAVATGQKAEAAGSSMLRMTGRFEAAVAGAVPQDMLDMEDITEEDLEALEAATDKLQGYADVAGMTAEQFASLWKTSPSKALQSFVEGLHNMDKAGGSAVQALKDLGINNVRDQQLFLGLANTTDVLSDSLTMSRNAWNGVSDEWGDAGDAQREADKKMQGFSGTLQILKNNGQHLASVMGESLAPTLKGITDVVAGLVGAFADLDPSMQQAITLSILGGAALGPTLTAYGAMSNAVKSAKTSWKEYTSAGNKVARMESSGFARVTGMSRKYASYSKEVGKLEKRLSGLNRAASDPRVLKNPVFSGNVSKQLRATETSLSKVKRSMGAMTKIQAFTGLLGSIGSMAAISAVVVGLEQVGTYLYDVHQKSEEYRQSTEGLSDATTKLKIASADASTDIGLMAASMQDATYQQGQYFSKVQDVIKANAELAQTVQDKVNGAFSDSASAEFYAEKIAELAGNCDGSIDKLSELQAYIDEYNQLTGNNIKVVDDFNGAVNLSAEALEKQKEAFVQMTLAEAYKDVLKDAATQVAKTETEIAKMGQSLDDVYKEAEKYGYSKEEFDQLANPDMGGLTELDDGYWDAMAQYYSTLSPEIAALIAKNKELLQSQGELENQLEKDKELRDAAADAYTEQVDREKEATKAYEDEAKKRSSISAINDALHNNKFQDDVDFEQMANELGYYDENVQQLCDDLADAGIGSAELAAIGTTAFMDLYSRATEAGGGLDEVVKAIHLVNVTGIDPKDIEIDDGSITIAKDALTDLDRQKLLEKGYTVNDNGTVTVELDKVDALKEDLEELGDTNPKPEVKASTDEAKRKIQEVIDLLAKVMSKTITIKTKNVSTYDSSSEHGADGPGNASGGITRYRLRIPAHASGGLSGIATKATLTNLGWVGEKGAEAIIPLTNRRYVRPFARAVASEMGGSQQTQVVNKYYSVNGMTLEPGSSAAEALEALYDAIRLEEAV